MHVMWKMVGGEVLRLMPFGKVKSDWDIMPFGRVKLDCDIMGRAGVLSQLS